MSPLTIQIADQEITRAKELDSMLDFMYQQLEQLRVIDCIPENFEQRDILVNRALDVRSACMRYLAVNICHNATSFGTMGKVHSNMWLMC